MVLLMVQATWKAPCTHLVAIMAILLLEKMFCIVQRLVGGTQAFQDASEVKKLMNLQVICYTLLYVQTRCNINFC